MIKHATWIDFKQRLNTSFTSVEFFVGSYPKILEGIDMDKLNEQFIEYQTFGEGDIPDHIKTICNIDDDEDERMCRMDVLWGT